MTDRELMQQALDALNSGVDVQMGRVVWTEYDSCLIAKAVTALNERLAQPAPQPEQPKLLPDGLYNELLFAIARVHPNETRHQTALRYIQQAESGGVDQCTAANNIKEKNI